MKNILTITLIIALGVGIAFMWMPRLFPQPAPQKIPVMPGTSDQMDYLARMKTSEPLLPVEKTISVLFIGSSYITNNDLPSMLGKVNASDPSNSTRLEIQSAAVEGGDLAMQWQVSYAPKMLAAREWDFVVLQENSLWATTPGQIPKTHFMVDLIKNKMISGRIMLMLTWPRQPGSSWYTGTENTDLQLQNADFMLQQLNEQTNTLAIKTDSIIVPIGNYWMTVLKQNPDLNLYHQDGTHPSLGGTYLAALTFYQVLTGRSAAGATFHPPQITLEQADIIKRAVSAGAMNGSKPSSELKPAP